MNWQPFMNKVYNTLNNKVQKFTYAQTLQELTVTGVGFYILLSPTIPSQFNVIVAR